jgi:hypothetical protein
MAYANCKCGSCPRVLYYSNNRTTHNGLPVGSDSLENNIRTMELNVPVASEVTERLFTDDRVSTISCLRLPVDSYLL